MSLPSLRSYLPELPAALVFLAALALADFMGRELSP